MCVQTNMLCSTPTHPGPILYSAYSPRLIRQAHLESVLNGSRRHPGQLLVEQSVSARRVILERGALADSWLSEHRYFFDIMCIFQNSVSVKHYSLITDRFILELNSL